ncbi:MAG: hydroxymethylglutaryl-CoA lyase [Candidatus Kapaibacterium sp.]
MNITINEVGMRDGLQMEKKQVPADIKKQWIEMLISSGIKRIQLGSFVHPVKVPQMADTDELFRFFTAKYPEVKFSGLALNEKGVERGMACGVEIFSMGVSASETHSMKNTGMSSSEAADRIIAMAKDVISTGKKVQVSVQSAFGCGFEGNIAPERVYTLIDKYLEAGINFINLADTAGHANPLQVERMIKEIKRKSENIEIACHFHNTYGLGMANCLAAMKQGVSYFETAAGGLGGCPFTKVAAGNVCTEDMVHFLQREGFRPDINLSGLIELAKEMSGFFEKELPGHVYKTGPLTIKN